MSKAAKKKAAPRSRKRVSGKAAELYRLWCSVPDWRDASQYPKPDSSGALQFWGIEFLRRNAGFRKCLRERLAKATAEELRQPPAAVMPIPMPGSIQFDVFRGYWTKPRVWPRHASANAVARGEAGLVHLEFDLRYPIDEQIKAASTWLKHCQAESIKAGSIAPLKGKRVQEHLLPLYLRLLDAEAESATPDDIADGLNAELDGPSAEQIREWLSAAHRYRDIDYRVLLERVYKRHTRPTS